MSTATVTGRKRARTTPRTVQTAESLARFFISAGDVGTILAVSLIFFFLLYVVFPLFVSGSVQEKEPPGALEVADVLATGADELQLVGWVLGRDGTVTTFRLDTGEVLGEKRLADGKAALTAWSFSPNGPRLAFGFSDGTVRRGVDFESTYLEPEDIPEEIRGLEPGDTRRHEDGMVVVTRSPATW